MKHRTWPSRSDGSPFTALPLAKLNSFTKSRELSSRPSSSSSREPNSNLKSRTKSTAKIRLLSSGRKLSPSPSSPSGEERDFSALPYDILTKIAANFSHPNLSAASLVCKSWNKALRPLREAMSLLCSGKRYKHGRGGVKPNLQKALDLFLKGAARGLTMAMVDAGLVYWEMGRKDEGMALYRRAAELGDPAGQCNLGIAYLQDEKAVGVATMAVVEMLWKGIVTDDKLQIGSLFSIFPALYFYASTVYKQLGPRLVDKTEPAEMEEAIRWLFRAASAGHVRAQYQLALCLRQGRGVNHNMPAAAKWYLRAAEGGYVRAMYNVSLCYSVGEGFQRNHQQAKKWMKRAADHGHSKAQFEHGLSLFSEGEMMTAVVYLELASRAGEAGASPLKDVILQQLSAASRGHAMLVADSWRALPLSH